MVAISGLIRNICIFVSIAVDVQGVQGSGSYEGLWIVCLGCVYECAMNAKCPSRRVRTWPDLICCSSKVKVNYLCGELATFRDYWYLGDDFHEANELCLVLDDSSLSLEHRE